jgi:hypothetical protein
MQDSRRLQWIEIYRDGLLNDTVPFWLKHAPDETARRVHDVS